MRNTLKATTIENKLPLLAVENGCIVSKDADLTVAFEVTLPELYTVTSQEYETIHGCWCKAVKVLPAYMTQTVQATVVQQQPQQQQRDARLDKLRGLMSQAKQLGILVRDKADPNAGLLGWVWAKYGVAADELAALSTEQITDCEAHVAGVIADKQELDRQQAEAAAQAEYAGMAEYEAAGLAENDIDF